MSLYSSGGNINRSALRKANAWTPVLCFACVSKASIETLSLRPVCSPHRTDTALNAMGWERHAPQAKLLLQNIHRNGLNTRPAELKILGSPVVKK